MAFNNNNNWWPFNNNRASDPWFDANAQSCGRDGAKMVFYSQLAHGSKTEVIQDFSTVQELYRRIAEAFHLPDDGILFCTLNTHKLDMNRLLGSALSPEDFIFCHCAGQSKELELLKSETQIGLTITDNGNGLTFVKSIQPGSLAARHGAICVGDAIHRINDVSAVGLRHYDIAGRLREIETGTVIKFRVVSPLSSGFSMIGPKRKSGGPNRLEGSGAGRKTLRFRADGRIVVEDETDTNEQERCAIARVDSLLESYLGVSDLELAGRFWSLAKGAANPSDLSVAIDQGEDADLKAFSFGSTTFVYDLWGIFTDMKRNQNKK